MLITKLFEVRDRLTFIPCLAIKTQPCTTDTAEQDAYLLGRAGYGQPLVLFGKLETPALKHNPEEWADRTMQVAHDWIEQNWENLCSGDVVDVEFVLGERPEPKDSERLVSLSADAQKNPHRGDQGGDDSQDGHDPIEDTPF